MNAIERLESIKNVFSFGLEFKLMQYHNGQMTNYRLDYECEELDKKIKALTEAIEALKCDKVARIREYVQEESCCGVMRSMNNTIRSNAMKDVANFIDELEDEQS